MSTVESPDRYERLRGSWVHRSHEYADKCAEGWRVETRYS